MKQKIIQFQSSDKSTNIYPQTIYTNILDKNGSVWEGYKPLTMVATLPTKNEYIYSQRKLYLVGDNIYFLTKKDANVNSKTDMTVVGFPHSGVSNAFCFKEDYLYVPSRGNSADTFYKYDVSSGFTTNLGLKGISQGGVGNNTLIGDDFYVFEHTKTQKINLVSQTITTLKSVSVPYPYSACIVGNYIYVFGRSTGSPINYCAKYDPSTDTSTKINYNEPFSPQHPLVVGNTIWDVRYNGIFCLDLSNNTITKKAEGIDTDAGPQCVAGKYFLIFNETGIGGYKYDYAKNILTPFSKDNTSNLSNSIAYLKGNYVYLWGGKQEQGPYTTYFNKVYAVYLKTSYLWKKIPTEKGE